VTIGNKLVKEQHPNAPVKNKLYQDIFRNDFNPLLIAHNDRERTLISAINELHHRKSERAYICNIKERLCSSIVLSGEV